MDLLASFLSSVLVEAGRVLCVPVYSSIRNTVKLKSNLITLHTQMNNLNEELVSAEEERKWPTTQVKEWVTNVENIISEASSMQDSKRKTCGRYFNCWKRQKLGNKVAKMLKEIERLKKDANFPAVGRVSVNSQAETVVHVPGPIEHQETGSRSLAQLVNLLENDENRRIGVWGMGGVGKTTLVKTMNNKLRSTASVQPFGMVIWATVSRVSDLKVVQTQIAERLNMDVRSDETVEGLAIRLYQRLEKEKNFLLILDDVWEEIDLDDLGIPEVLHTNSKIILTSRSLEVCRAMKTDVNVKVNKFDDKEAWELFSQNAGNIACFAHIKPLAEAIVQECDGLPLAIVTMGKAMRGKEMVRLWKHALNELRRSVPCMKGIEDKVYKPLKWSYDTLEGNNIKSCFLYCSLYPEDFSIEVSELVQCWLAEGLIDGQRSYEDILNKGISLLENMKDSCLLEDGARKGTVKMHDVVRDVAIWIASTVEEGCKSLVRSGTGLSEILEADLSSSTKRISLMNNKIRRLPDQVQCSEASTLLLQGNHPLRTIPDTFLLGFQALKVLNLSRTNIQSLPLSLLQLNEIRCLLLRECYYLHEFPPLGGVNRLQVLDLCATGIRELPKGMEELSHLKLVDLSRTHYLKNIAAGVMSRLSLMEVLDMTLSAYYWGIKEQVEEEQATFEELINLQRLLVLSARLKCIPLIGSESDVVGWMGRLKRFQFFIGPQANSLPTRYDKRRVTISGLNLAEAWLGWLLCNAKSLILNHCQGLNHMLETLTIDSMNSFAGLKSLTISNSTSSLRPAGGCAAHYDMLPNLVELHLDHLSYLGSISELVGHLGLRFSRLRLIEVAHCPRLKNLLSYGSFIIALDSLEEIRVSSCDMLAELFSYCPGQLHVVELEPVASRLRVMEFKNLPKLKTLCRQEESWQSLEQVEVVKCNLLRQLPLTHQNANTIKEIRGELSWWEHLMWPDSDTKSSLETCFKQVTAPTLQL